MARTGAAEVKVRSRTRRRPRRARAIAPRWPLRRLSLIAVAVLCGAALIYELTVHTPLSAVQEVRVVGVRGVDARAIDAALERSARSMSTLSVDEGALQAAVAAFPVVRSVSATASFPHTLRIIVVEQLPAAVVQVGSVTTAVAADGHVLGSSFVSSRLPRVTGSFRLRGESLLGAHAKALLAISAAAPAPLAAVVESIYYGSRGVTAAFHGGLRVYFGDGSLARAKWISLVRVLTAPSSHGASSIDVRVPGRPAAAFQTAPGETSSATSPLTGEALISALTAALSSGGQTPANAATTTVQQPTETQAQTPTPTEATPEPTG